MWAVDVGGDYQVEAATVLLAVGLDADVEHAFGVGVAKVGVVGGAEMDDVLGQLLVWGDAVGEDACGEDGEQLFHLGDTGSVLEPRFRSE